MGISSQKIKKISRKLDQPSRRFEKIYDRKNITIIDDYAHHHNAIKEVRKFIEDDEDARTILVFQPHRFTRLKKHYKDFLNEISLWKEVIVSDIYSAFEKRQKFTSKDFVYELKKINKSCKAYYINDYDKIVMKLKKEIFNNNSHIRIITMGAGDIRKVGTKLIKTIKNG
jgi:UDP-N-acetylmuramate--alanine ligase